jgi:hypothetical protein
MLLLLLLLVVVVLVLVLVVWRQGGARVGFRLLLLSRAVRTVLEGCERSR